MDLAARDPHAQAAFDAAPNVLKDPTFGCTVKEINDVVQLRCPLSAGHLIDVSTVEGVGGRWDFLPSSISDVDVVLWTVRRRDLRANGFSFDGGMYELAFGAKTWEWALDATWQPGGAALARKTVQCCLERQKSADACIGRPRLAHALGCRAHADCASFDSCVEADIVKRSARRQ
jgi:hypothetical protein